MTLTDSDWDQHTESDTTDRNMNTIGGLVSSQPGEQQQTNEGTVYNPNELRQMAKDYFDQQDYESALPLYSMAIDFLKNSNQNEWMEQMTHSNNTPSLQNQENQQKLLIALLCNRSACYYRMELYEDSKNDAWEAVQISNHQNAKAYFRLVRALLALQDTTTAIQTIETALQLLSSPLSMTHLNSSPSNTEQQQQQQAEEEQNQQMVQDFMTLLRTAKKQQSERTVQNQSITYRMTDASYTPSIRDFIMEKELGQGNFSRVVICSHKETKETFALKIIEKKRAEQLSKRDHPNVYNEIQMEQRILTHVDKLGAWRQRLHRDDGHDEQDMDTRRNFLIKLYFAFQDYNCLYFLMQLHGQCGDLWSTMRYSLEDIIYKETTTNELQENNPKSNSNITITGKKFMMVGAHSSLVKTYLWEILQGLEFLHSRGIVHRDIKTENILLSNTGHVVIIDFGTAKDCIDTDLNGPEFVGTPDFMAPEAVVGEKEHPYRKRNKRKGKTKDRSVPEASSQSKLDASATTSTTTTTTTIAPMGADHAVDLWAFGAVAYQLLTGTVPFHSPSPFLTFLKIQRGIIFRPMGIVDDDAWDLITSLMKVDPKKRLGFDCFQFVDDLESVSDSNNAPHEGHEEKPEVAHTANESNKTTVRRKVISSNDTKTYDVIRNHAYFSKFQSQVASIQGSSFHRPIPSLRDLCIRACSTLVHRDFFNVELDTQHPPGDKSNHDMLLLNQKDRLSVMHVLDKLRVLSEPRIFRRFFQTKQEARLNKVRPWSCDFVGLTQMNDKQGEFPVTGDHKDRAMQEPIDVTAKLSPIRFLHLSNPLFLKEHNSNCDDATRNDCINKLKECIKLVNKLRPKALVVSGYIDHSCRKLLAKVNETIPIVLNDGCNYFSFWLCGGQGLVLRSSDFLMDQISDSSEQIASSAAGNRSQIKWLSQELEQSRITQHQLFAFVDCDPALLPERMLQKLARGKVLALFGLASSAGFTKSYKYSEANGSSKVKDRIDCENDSSSKDYGNKNDYDDSSASSSEDQLRKILIISRSDSSLRSVTLDEFGGWKNEVVATF